MVHTMEGKLGYMSRSHSWEEFKKALLGRFLPRKKREAKVEDFINLCQGGMSVQGYFLKFTKLSKYAPSLVSNRVCLIQLRKNVLR